MKPKGRAPTVSLIGGLASTLCCVIDLRLNRFSCSEIEEGGPGTQHLYILFVVGYHQA